MLFVCCCSCAWMVLVRACGFMLASCCCNLQVTEYWTVALCYSAFSLHDLAAVAVLLVSVTAACVQMMSRMDVV